MKDKEREKLTFEVEEARDMFIGGVDAEDFEEVCEEIIENTRWSIVYDLVVKRISDDKYFRSIYSRGATESQEELPWESEGKAEFIQVFPRTVTSVIYE